MYFRKTLPRSSWKPSLFPAVLNAWQGGPADDDVDLPVFPEVGVFQDLPDRVVPYISDQSDAGFVGDDRPAACVIRFAGQQYVDALLLQSDVQPHRPGEKGEAIQRVLFWRFLGFPIRNVIFFHPQILPVERFQCIVVYNPGVPYFLAGEAAFP